VLHLRMIVPADRTGEVLDLLGGHGRLTLLAPRRFRANSGRGWAPDGGCGPRLARRPPSGPAGARSDARRPGPGARLSPAWT
jgi:hypothetical protein